MTPEQAWQILANLCVQMRLTMEEHKQLQMALQLLKPKEEKAE